MKYGIRTIARIWNELGWTFTSARYCQAIRDANKEKRLAWCKQHINEKECFQDVIFTDESTFQLESHQRKCFWKKKTPRRLKYRHKHPPKIHVWGGISKRGATHLVMFERIMNATRYGDILSASLVPWFGRRIQMATDYIKIMILNIRVNTFRVSFYRMISHGGRAQRKAPT